MGCFVAALLVVLRNEKSLRWVRDGNGEVGKAIVLKQRIDEVQKSKS